MTKTMHKYSEQSAWQAEKHFKDLEAAEISTTKALIKLSRQNRRIQAWEITICTLWKFL